jgi:hypothetical protein
VRPVTLVRAEPRLLTVVDADEILWLLPGVRFTDAEGSSWEVLTVADDYVAYVTPRRWTPPNPRLNPWTSSPGHVTDSQTSRHRQRTRQARPCAPTRGEVDPRGVEATAPRPCPRTTQTQRGSQAVEQGRDLALVAGRMVGFVVKIATETVTS